MSEKEGWIKIVESDSSYDDMIDNMTEVLGDMGIDVWNDEEKAKEEKVDIYIRLEKKE